MSISYRTSADRPLSLLTRMVTGSLAGLFAAGPMGLFMMMLHRFLPAREQYHLPPRQITMEIAERTDVAKHLDTPGEKRFVTWISHLGYGAVAGSLYPILTRPFRLQPVFKGMVFALIIWMVSYLGWIPASGILPPATQQPLRRNGVMVVSHLLWGSLIGLMVDTLEKKE